jgi:hypothetical protein
MPRDMAVSSLLVRGVEGDLPAPVLCTAFGQPPPEVTWTFQGEVVSQTGLLEFRDPIHR